VFDCETTPFLSLLPCCTEFFQSTITGYSGGYFGMATRYVYLFVKDYAFTPLGGAGTLVGLAGIYFLIKSLADAE
jgi:hypothetical protein